MRRRFSSVLAMMCLAAANLGRAQVIISEFQAANDTTLRDEDGDAEDWVEIFNRSRETVDLAGWRLTDTAADLGAWTFPSTNIAPGQFLVVFASNKNRRQAGRPLHTNFKLSADGEYLALVDPRDQIATEFRNGFPPQPLGASFGFPWGSSNVSLLSSAAPARISVPRDGSSQAGWMSPEFDDGNWAEEITGTDLDGRMRGINASVYMRVPFVVGDPADVAQLGLRLLYDDGFIAYLNGQTVAMRNSPVASDGELTVSSIDDWVSASEQGARHWSYGYYDKGADADGQYDAADDFESADPQWAWNGGAWVLGPSNPPWDFITANTWRPNGANSGGTHWVIRRWQSPGAGVFVCHLEFGKQNSPCGNGVTLRVLQNGQVQFAQTLAAGNTTGIRADVALPSVQAGDLIDFALDPLGPDGREDDACDTSTFSVVIEQKASPGLDWNSTATTKRSLAEAALPEEFDLTRYRDLLSPGTNMLAIQGLNAAVEDPTLPLVPELTATRLRIDAAAPVYFATPTPGAPNGSGEAKLGPVLSGVSHTPAAPAASEPLQVTARVTRTVAPVEKVVLKYRLMFGAEAEMAMLDDGQHNDGRASDGIFGAQIPGDLGRGGQMVRYYVTAWDTASNQTRLPTFSAPKASAQYFGAVIADPTLTNSKLPVLHWFIQNPASANSDATARASLSFNGEFYDNIGVNLHGQSTRDFPKKSYDFDFNPDAKFRWSEAAPRVDDLNLLTTWADKAHLRNALAYDTYWAAGVPGHFAFPVRVQQNGAFHSVANLVENGDDNFLKRLGLDPAGAFYKMYNIADSTSGAEKKTRKNENRADLQALISGMGNANAAARQTFLFDNLDVPEVINFLAARAITADVDCCHKNYYLYRDSDGTGEWQAMPWDVDLSFGRVWTCGSPCLSYFDPTIYTNQSIFVGANNRIFSRIYDTPATRQMYLRRLRTLMDSILQPPGTAANLDWYRSQTLVLRDQIGPDAALDLAKWGSWGSRESITQAVNRIWNEFLPGRRAYLFQTLASANRGQIPPAQATSTIVQFGPLEFRGSRGAASQEWLSLTNATTNAVDISGWRLDGAVRFTFRPGTVIPGRAGLIASPDVKAFRGRAASPRGGEQRLVVGPYRGDLSAWGETVILTDSSGRVVDTRSYAGDPSPAQRYLRLTELHFHPDSWAGNTDLPPQQFEFVELRNIGPAPLDLEGIRFTAGISFDFNSSAIQRLAPGASIVLVRHAGAFRQRYGESALVAGEFAGSLDNAGEELRLDDEFGEKIVELEYQPGWRAQADGGGWSLAIRDTTSLESPDAEADPDNWIAAAPTPGSSNDTPYPATARPDGLLVPTAGPARFATSDLLSNDSDSVDGAVAWMRAAPASAAGAQVGTDGAFTQYTPPPGFEGSDEFSYVIRNAAGVLSTGKVEVLVYAGELPASGHVSIHPRKDGLRLRYAGASGQLCRWERSRDLKHWETVVTGTIPAHGIYELFEPAPPPEGAAYRAAIGGAQ